MKQNNRILVLAFAILCAASIGYADVAPEPGYTRAYSDLILDPQDDFPDFRFFWESGGTLEEVKIHKGEQNTIRYKGGGARYSNATVYAVPRKAITALGEDPTAEKLSSLLSEITAGRIAGAIKLLDHGFVQEVRETDARTVTDEKFRLQRNKDGVVATPVSISPPKTSDGPSFGVTAVSRTLSPAGWILVAGLGIAVAALLIFGIIKLGKRPMR